MEKLNVLYLAINNQYRHYTIIIMDLGFTTDGIIKISNADLEDDYSTTEPIDELAVLICKVGVCVKYKGSNDVYEAFKRTIKRMEKNTYRLIKDKYGIKTDDEFENHSEIETIRAEVEKTNLFWSHGFTETKVGYIPLKGRYTSEEISAISDMYELTETFPLIFIRKTDKGESTISYLRFDDEKKSLTTFDMHLKFYAPDEASPQRKPLIDVLNGTLKALDYDSLTSTKTKDKACSLSMVRGLIKLIGMMCLINLTIGYFMK